jgi:hypothetical protein
MNPQDPSQSPQFPPQSLAVNRGSMLKGFGVGAAVNVCAAVVGLMGIVIVVGSIVLLAFGVVQLAWIIPMYRSFNRRGETETAKGLLVAAGIAFLLNAGCWGLVLNTKVIH